MTNNKNKTTPRKTKKPAQPKKPTKPKQSKQTPFGDVGSKLGGTLGGMFGASGLGNRIGRWLGSGIGSIYGSGDYKISNSSKYNCLTNDNQIPKFSTTHQTNIVSHREYLGDITGTTAFNNIGYALNPGVETTFPWLSTVAENYQQYKFHGLIFEFRSLLTDYVTSGAPGVIVMSTNYNSDVPVYVNKQQMENAEFAVSTKPTVSMIHGVECAKQQTPIDQLYVRTGPVPSGQDLRLYDQGLFQFATQSNPNQDLGELWVSYVVEFFKPIMPITPGGSLQSYHSIRNSPTTTNPLGTQISASGDLAGGAVNGNNLGFTALQGVVYLINVVWSGSTTTISYPTFTTLGATPVARFNGGQSTFVLDPNNGAVSASANYQETIVYSGPQATNNVNISVTGGIVPSGANIDVYITVFDNSVVA